MYLLFAILCLLFLLKFGIVGLKIMSREVSSSHGDERGGKLDWIIEKQISIIK